MSFIGPENIKNTPSLDQMLGNLQENVNEGDSVMFDRCEKNINTCTAEEAEVYSNEQLLPLIMHGYEKAGVKPKFLS